MKVGLLSQWYEPEPQTIPRVLATELMRRSHSVRVLTGFPNYPKGRIFEGYRVSWRRDEVVSGVPVRRVALYPSHGRSTWGRLANYGTFAASASLWGAGWLREVEGLWVYNSPPSVGLPTWLIKARYRPRVVLHIMDLWPESLIASGLGAAFLKWSWLERALDRWLSMTYRVADVIACTSRGQVALLAARGVPAAKLSFAPLWVDETVFRPTSRDEELATSLGVAGKTVLLYAGALGEPQGLDPLIEACQALRDEPKFHCLVAGTGVAEKRLRREAVRRGLTNLSFLGQWPAGDMTRLMSVGDVHLVSLRADPIAEVAMPSKLPATLASGKPVIVAARGEAQAVVATSAAGWTCEPGEARQLESAIRQALAAGECELREMGRKGRETYEREFALGVSVGRIESLLRDGSGGPDGV